MSNASKIEWLEGGASWNPVTGCTPVHSGCVNCYAKAFAHRQMGPWKGREFSEVVLHMDRLFLPCGWKVPRRVFVCSMGDLFHKDVPFSFVNDAFVTMGVSAPWHEYIILTKRPERMWQFVEMWTSAFPLPANLTLGVSCSTQEHTYGFLSTLANIPKATRVVSLEPLLGPIDLGPWLPSLHGVIVGGESGPKARPCNLDWLRSIVAQCKAADVPVFVKQVGAKPIAPDVAELVRINARKGNDMAEWPEDLRVREWHR